MVMVAWKKNPNELERDRLKKEIMGQHDGSWYGRGPYHPPVPDVLPKAAIDKVGSGHWYMRACTVPSARTELSTYEKSEMSVFFIISRTNGKLKRKPTVTLATIRHI
jgi:hypothetical protein